MKTWSRVDVLPIDPVTGGTGPADPTLQGRVVVFQADPFEYNDNRLSPTEISDLATTHLNPSIESFAQLDPEIPTPNDEDWYVIEPTKTTTFRLDVRFETIASVPSGRPGLPGNGDLDIAVYDIAGTLIAAGTTAPGSGDQVAFGAAGRDSATTCGSRCAARHRRRRGHQHLHARRDSTGRRGTPGHQRHGYRQPAVQPVWRQGERRGPHASDQ